MTPPYEASCTNGDAAALGGHPAGWYERARENLLVNGEFSVWQRGTSFEHAASDYLPDCWFIGKGNATTDFNIGKASDGARITYNAAGSQVIFRYRMELDRISKLVGRLTTIAASVDGVVYTCTGTLTSGTRYVLDITKGKWEIRDVLQDTPAEMVTIGLPANVPVTVNFVKLEYGDHFTGWCPVDPALELMRCQRRYVPLIKWARLRASCVTANFIDFAVPIPVQMRITPKPIGKFIVNSLDTTTEAAGFQFYVTNMSPGFVLIRAEKANHGLKDAALNFDGAALDARL